MRNGIAAATPAPSEFMLNNPGAELAIVIDPLSAVVDPFSTATFAGPLARPAGTTMLATMVETPTNGASCVLAALSVICTEIPPSEVGSGRSLAWSVCAEMNGPNSVTSSFGATGPGAKLALLVGVAMGGVLRSSRITLYGGTVTGFESAADCTVTTLGFDEVLTAVGSVPEMNCAGRLPETGVPLIRTVV